MADAAFALGSSGASLRFDVRPEPVSVRLRDTNLSAAPFKERWKLTPFRSDWRLIQLVADGAVDVV